MPNYRFVSSWVLETERERVWEAIYDSDSWPLWWRGVERAERLADGDENGLNQRGRYEWRARAPYTVSFEIVSTRVERPHLLEGEASGELAGTGRWRFFEQAGEMPVTAVLYEWDVRTTRAWMNLVAPIAKPIFRANHDWVMRNGATGVAGLLGCRLLALN